MKIHLILSSNVVKDVLLVSIDVVRIVCRFSVINTSQNISILNLELRVKVLDLDKVFFRDENHFGNLSQIVFLFHHFFTSDSRPIMSNEFDNQFL